MKKIIIMLMIGFNVNAGELHWITDNGNESRLNCTIEAHSHRDSPTSMSEYWIDCSDNNIMPILNNINNKSSIYINDRPVLTCPMIDSIFGTGDVFYMILDCRTTIFKNGFSLN